MAGEEKNSITVTPKQLGIYIAIGMAIAGGIPTGVNKFTTDARNDPFTGTEGVEIHGRIDLVEAQLDTVVGDDKDCKYRQELLESELRALTLLVTNYQSETRQRDDNQEKAIDMCIEDLRRRMNWNEHQ